ncbi:helix-turn-helix domain-containing protein [Spirillospora sp. NBC_01491]|uniref:helix-turn-helix domain-containing protein n=1 Tax=Spirillospora sp. NBC_01491 TaxID=2976007 RepID=UPI002E2EC356|nr:helix-turn-helix transcriptional regulator [Spirillospora sp. NBC_01491]
MAEIDNPARVFFGTELRRKRDESRLTGKELADTLGCTPQWISTMESGRKISEQSAHDLDTFFKLDGHFHRLWDLANDIELRTVLPPGFTEYAARESKASTVRMFCGLLVDGLFQTEGYAGAVVGSINGSNTSDLINNRLERQSILTQSSPPRVWLTIDEVILRRVIGDHAVMREQLTYLLTASEHQNMMLQVVPYKAGYHAGLGGSFTILGFDDGSSNAYTESAGVGTLIKQPARLSDFVVRWDLLKGHALPVAESRAMVRAAMEEL